MKNSFESNSENTKPNQSTPEEKYKKKRLISEEVSGKHTFEVTDMSFLAGSAPYILSTEDEGGNYYEIGFSPEGEVENTKTWEEGNSHPNLSVPTEVLEAAKDAFKKFSQ